MNKCTILMATLSSKRFTIILLVKAMVTSDTSICFYECIYENAKVCYYYINFSYRKFARIVSFWQYNMLFKLSGHGHSKGMPLSVIRIPITIEISSTARPFR